MRIAAFGFRTIPPSNGAAGSDKFVYELLPRLAKMGHTITAYNRLYKNNKKKEFQYKGIKIVTLKTIAISGFDTLLHSLKSTIHIIYYNTGDIVHIQNGGNSIWALFLRIFGKKVFISQDGIDWKREKWKWYGKLYLWLSTIITAYLPNKVIFDNIYIKKIFKMKFSKQKNRFVFIPYGSEIEPFAESDILARLKLIKKKYILFVGRFIPDKGIHYLIEAYNKFELPKYKLIIVGGAPNRSEFEQFILSKKSDNIIMPGYIYGDDVNTLIKNAFLYVQPSDYEGLSPVILQVMGMGIPILCSDIEENLFIVNNDATIFRKSDVIDLKNKLDYCLLNGNSISKKAMEASTRIRKEYNWDKIATGYEELFSRK